MKHVLIILFALFAVSCGNSSSPKVSVEFQKIQQKKYNELGASIVQSSFKALSEELKSAIMADGIDSAIRICNAKALQITDSLSSEYQVEIKRTSLKVRNPNNKPSVEEKQVLKLYQKARINKQDLKPIVIVKDSSTSFYYSPITTQALCLNCHGEAGVSMQVKTALTIADLYPSDRAINYKLDDLRGMWSLTFKTK